MIEWFGIPLPPPFVGVLFLISNFAFHAAIMQSGLSLSETNPVYELKESATAAGFLILALCLVSKRVFRLF